MILSMTGFGRVDFEVDGASFWIEVRTVNHRHLDVSVRLPRGVSGEVEGELRRRVQAGFRRGRVDVSVSAAPGAGARSEPEIDREAARRYLDASAALAGELGVPGELPMAVLLGLPGVARLVEHPIPPEQLAQAILAAAERALGAVAAMRAAEGEALDRELRARLDGLLALVEQIASRADEVLAAARERLRKRVELLRDAAGSVDEARLSQELVLAADRQDVTEEMVRLRSHVEQFRASLDADGGDGPVGRRLDFLIQEMVREANTTGSKAADAGLAHWVVDLKTELERLREQVQNVE